MRTERDATSSLLWISPRPFRETTIDCVLVTVTSSGGLTIGSESPTAQEWGVLLVVTNSRVSSCTGCGADIGLFAGANGGRVSLFWLQGLSARNLALFILLLLGMLLGSGPAFAQDAFPGTSISGNGSLTGSNTGATSETGEPVTFGGGAVESMWYSWTAPATGVAVVGTCNQTGNTFGNFDTTLGVYTGAAVGSLTVVGTNDDTAACAVTPNAGYGSLVQFNAVSGTTYRFQVDGYGDADGNFNLHYGMAGITIAVTDNIAVEGGAGGQFTIRLNTPPRANATISVGTSTQCTFSPTSRTFTNANWATPQTIAVTATNDVVVEGVHSCAPATITGAGGAYAGLTGTPPTIIVYDNEVASFTIAKSVNLANIAAPSTLNYTITVVNTSGINMTAPVLTDALTQSASPLTLTSGPTGPSGDGGTVGRLDIGETWTWTATYAVPQSGIDNAGNITNTATFDTAQTAPSGASVVTTVTASPSMAVTKVADDTTNVVVGQVLTYTYVVTNTGNQTITGIAMSDLHNGSGPAPVPSGETLTSDVAPTGTSTDATPSNGVWSILAPGDAITFTGTYTVTQQDVDTLQ